MNKNLSDTIKDTKNVPTSYQSEALRASFYNKAQKLITALYMVTDIIEKEEPIRFRLRTLGLEILSDPEGKPSASYGAGMSIMKIEQVLSLLNIASAMNFISEMNYTILNKEFIALKDSIHESTQIKPMWLEEFLESSPLEGWPKAGVDKLIPPPPKGYSSRGELISKGHTRIGVQKGGTLLKALNEVSDKNLTAPAQDFDMLRKERRYNIVNIIKNSGGSATIKDIKDKANSELKGTFNFSEKTLQRELMSMIKDGVLYKTGEKRWTRYSLLGN